MTARLAVLVLVASCYDVPEPDCGFVCGPGGACPENYVCFLEGGSDEGVCKRSSPPYVGDCPDVTPPELPDTFRPRVTLITPPNDSTDVVLDPVIVARFNEDIVYDGLGIGFELRSSVATIFGQIMQTDARRISFVPNQQLEPNTPYTVTIQDTVRDLAGNTMVPFTSVFVTGSDSQPPRVTDTDPIAGETNIAVVKTITAFFSEPVNGVDSTNFHLENGLGERIDADVVPVQASIWQLNPRIQLAPVTPYTIRLTAGIRDLSGNQMFPAPVQVQFMTGLDGFAPNVVTRDPEVFQTSIPIDRSMEVSFDEPVMGVDASSFVLTDGATPIAATVSYDAPSRRAILDPDAPLANGTTYTLQLTSAIRDLSNNALVAQSWMFTTIIDTTPPTLVATMPFGAQSNVPLDATIRAMFSEPVITIDATTFLVTGAGTGTYAASDGGATWTFTPDAPMPADATITVMLTAGISDVAGNAFAPVTYAFTTAP